MEKISRAELFALLTRSEVERASNAGRPAQSELIGDKESDSSVSDEPKNQPAFTSSIEVPSTSGTIAYDTPHSAQMKTGNADNSVRVQGKGHGGWKSESAHLQYLLAKAVPRLWVCAKERCASGDTRQLRAKLRDLLVWLFAKEGFKAVARAPAPYRLKGRDVAGRVDVLVSNQEGKVLLAIEADWTREESSIQKLRHWNQSGVGAAWIIGVPTDPVALTAWRSFADEASQSNSKGWLKIMHLEHGLIL